MSTVGRIFNIGFAIFFFVSCNVWADVAAVAEKPNIVLILADDLGYGDVGAYGATLIKTPNMDQLAQQGVRLTDFYSGAANCTPSRAALLTGRYAIRSGMAHQVIFVNDDKGLPTEEVTIAEMLRSVGYSTALVGKWHLGHREQYWPTKQGFDEFYGLPYSNNQSPLPLYRDRTILAQEAEQRTLTRQFTEEAVNFISRQKDAPFFLYLAYTAPHIPLHVENESAGRSAAGLYGDVVESLDQGIGEILRTLDDLGLSEDTLVIVTSDNGPYPEGSTGGLRGTKGTVWEGGQRVPFIARWPAQIAPNLVSQGIAMNIDILPTIKAMTHAKLPDGIVLDGKDIRVLLNGGENSPHEALYFFNDEQIGAIRTQKWKAVFQSRYRGINRWFPDHDVRLLYDMELDPAENYSLADQEHEIWLEMNQRLEKAKSELQSLALFIEK